MNKLEPVHNNAVFVISPKATKMKNKEIKEILIHVIGKQLSNYS